MDSLLKRAKAFIGLEEAEDDVQLGSGRQLDITQIIRPKRERDRDRDKDSDDSAFEIMIYEPKIYEDSLGISGNLRKGKPVIVNLKHLEPSEGTRLIDFICGAAYAIDGHMMKIGESIFLFSPGSVRITDAEERASIGEEISSFGTEREGFFSNR